MNRAKWFLGAVAAFLSGSMTANGQAESAAQKEEVKAIAIIFDCSGSMSELTRDAEPKMMAAKRVVSALLDNLPDGLEVAFTVYGHDAKMGCEAVKTVRPLAPFDDAGRQVLKEFVQRLRPTGQTPIANALHTVGEELAKTKKRCQIILVTDGMETCGGDPAAEATELLKHHDLKSIDVVGLGVHANELAGVKSIAAAGKGEFFDARTAKDLGAAFKKVVPAAAKIVVTEPPVHSDPAVVSGIKVNKVNLKGFPSLTVVYVYRHHDDREPGRADFVQKGYDRSSPLALQPGIYDVVGFAGPPCDDDLPIRLATGLAVEPKQLITLDTNKLVSGITVKGIGLPGFKLDSIIVYPRGASASTKNKVQKVYKFGQTLMVAANVPVDVYVWPVEGEPIKLQTVYPKPGEMLVIGTEDKQSDESK